MNSQEFVAAIERHVRDAAIEDTISNLKAPPGRRVPPSIRMRSSWYNGLSEADAENVNSVIATAVHATLFGLFAVLDGARTIDDDNGRLELIHVADQRILLNHESISLHDMLSPPS